MGALIAPLVGLALTVLGLVVFLTPFGHALQQGYTGKGVVQQQTFALANTEYMMDHNGAVAADQTVLQDNTYLPDKMYDQGNVNPYTQTNYGTNDYVIHTNVAKDPTTLAGYMKFAGAGVAPTTLCGTACTKIVVDSRYGPLGE